MRWGGRRSPSRWAEHGDCGSERAFRLVGVELGADAWVGLTLLISREPPVVEGSPRIQDAGLISFHHQDPSPVDQARPKADLTVSLA